MIDRDDRFMARPIEDGQQSTAVKMMTKRHGKDESNRDKIAIH